MAQARRTKKTSALLALLSRLAEGSLRIGAVVVTQTAPFPRTKAIRQWQHEILDQDFAIDLEKQLHALKRRKNFDRTIREIRKRRFARLIHRNDTYVLTVTAEGRRYLRSYSSLNRLALLKPKHWDGLWRIVLFDIPEKQRGGRDALRSRLRELGFFQFQKSALVYPHPCFDEIDLVVQAYHLSLYVTFFETRELGYQESRALAHFQLTRSGERRKPD